ncbi:peptidase inhibitor family I36 protein [Aliivibrio logei]|uniref:peptidase inhibitor family I36 protein n=1 Tax=Aliivibrio logei TaxID=688 RepID=UPI0035C901B6
MMLKRFTYSTFLLCLSINAHSETLIEIDTKTPDIHRIIENAGNPLGPVSIFNFHHYALNRVPFDNSEIDFVNNPMGLSLRSVHPLFSENLAGLVQDYYDNGEKPPGATNSVWQFLMNADGMPSTYEPTIEDDRMCIYTHRRYKLSDIAADAANSITNLGFVNSPDQWWFQVSLYNQETNNFDLPAPDYIIRDHPEAAINNFSRMAIQKGAIQTQSNERWCFKYDEPAIIRIKKGSRVINENEFVWDNALADIVDIVVNVPNITGYPHFTGMSDLNITDHEFWRDDKIQYVGVDLLRDIFFDLESPSFNAGAADESIKNNSLTAVKIIWSKLVNFRLNGVDSTNDDFSRFITMVMNDNTISLETKFNEIKFESNKRTQKELKKAFKQWTTSHYQGILMGNLGTLDNINRFKNSIKTNGVKQTIKSIRLTNPVSVLKSFGPDQLLSMGFNIWQLADNIRNPGNSTSEIALAYIPGISDGMTLFIDTSTKTNNFHALTNFNNVKKTDYNTNDFPYELINNHMMSKLTDSDLNSVENACFYADKENLNEPSFCISENSEPQSPQSYISFVNIPDGYWVKADLRVNKPPFYLTESMESIGNLSSSILSRGDVDLSLVKAEDIQKNSDYCIYYNELFKGVAQCYNGELELTDSRVATDLNIENQDSEIFREQSKVKSYQKFSKKPFELVMGVDKKSQFITSVPYKPESIFGHDVVAIQNTTHAEAINFFQQNHGTEGVVIYEHSNQQGDSLVITSDKHDLGTEMNDKMSSWVLPTDWVVRFYEDANFAGRYYTRATSGNADGFHDIINSVKILSPRNNLVIFDYNNYGGDYMEITSDMAFLDSMNDRLQSFIIPEGWVVRFYEDANFAGRYYTRNSSGNAQEALSNNISSIKIMSRP